MTPLRILAIALPLLLTSTASVWTANAPSADCGPALTISDPQLRAMFAAADRARDSQAQQVCALARVQGAAGLVAVR